MTSQNIFLTALVSFSMLTPLKAASQESLKKLARLVPKSSETKSEALDLSNADMRSYNLCAPHKHKKINLTKANLRGANFSGMKISHVNFEGANIEGANFANTHISSCNFRDTQAAQAVFTRSTLRWSSFNGADLNKSLFNHAALESVGFDFAHMQKVNFDNAILFQVNFYSADLTGYTHKDASINKSNFEGAKGTSWLD
jgi:uncharacterized protein YjbI with pentapeptide repeats